MSRMQHQNRTSRALFFRPTAVRRPYASGPVTIFRIKLALSVCAHEVQHSAGDQAAVVYRYVEAGVSRGFHFNALATSYLRRPAGGMRASNARRSLHTLPRPRSRTCKSNGRGLDLAARPLRLCLTAFAVRMREAETRGLRAVST